MRSHVLSLALATTLVLGTARTTSAFQVEEPTGETPPAQTEPSQTEPAQGVFEAAITSGGETETYDNPAKAVSAMRRIVARERRKKETEEADFTATININGGEHEITDPQAAQKVLQAVVEAMRYLRQARMEFGDLGTIEPIHEPQPLTAGPNRPTPAQAMVIVRRRIQLAYQQEIFRRRRPLDPQTMQRIAREQVDRARQEGLLSEDPPMSFAESLRETREQQLEAVRTMLGRTLGEAVPQIEIPPDAETPEEPKTDSDK